MRLSRIAAVLNCSAESVVWFYRVPVLCKADDCNCLTNILLAWVQILQHFFYGLNPHLLPPIGSFYGCLQVQEGYQYGRLQFHPHQGEPGVFVKVPASFSLVPWVLELFWVVLEAKWIPKSINPLQGRLKHAWASTAT